MIRYDRERRFIEFREGPRENPKKGHRLGLTAHCSCGNLWDIRDDDEDPLRCNQCGRLLGLRRGGRIEPSSGKTKKGKKP